MNSTKFKLVLLSLAVGLLALFTSPAGAIEVTLNTTRDTFVYDYYLYDTLNYGGADYINIDPTQRPQGLVAFDNLPGDIGTVTSATLILDKKYTELHSTDPIYIHAYQVTDPVVWAEGTQDGEVATSGATWYQADYPAAWGSVPFSYNPASLDQEIVGDYDNSLDVTGAVQNWANGQLNYGLVLKLSGGGGAAYTNKWHSKESTTGTGPQLELVYVSDVPPLAGDVDRSGQVSAGAT